jgi:hypothetical protein
MNLLRTSLFGLLLAVAVTPLTAVTITQFSTPLTEDFNTLATATGSVVPADWQFAESGSGANTTYGAGTGSSNLGNTYSFGATDSTDRAFGSVRTSSVASTIGTLVTNETGSTLTQLAIQFTGEQWRLGTLSRVDQLDFGYSVDAASVTTGNWLEVDALDLVGPVTSGVTGALDGNAVENRVQVSHTLTGLNLLSGTSLWLRWVDFDASGSDDGLAIDNFSLTALPSGGGEDVIENVPEVLPLGTIIALLGGLFVVAARWHWIRTA